MSRRSEGAPLNRGLALTVVAKACQPACESNRGVKVTGCNGGGGDMGGRERGR